MKRPLSSLGLGGGVWRIKWNPYEPNSLLTASMHNGFHVLKIQNDNRIIQFCFHYLLSLFTID